LINPYTRFFRLSDLSSQRQFSINYYLAFKKEIITMLKDMLFSTLKLYQINSISPEIVANRRGHINYLKTDQGFEPQPFVKNDLRNEELPPENQIFSYMPYNLVWQAIAMTTLYGSSRIDDKADFIDYIAIHEEGSGDARTFAENTPIARFQDPLTRQVYYAAQTPDQLSIAYEYLKFVEDFRVNEWQVAYDRLQMYPNDPNYERGYYLVNQVMQSYIDLIDDLRQIRSIGDWAR
jgi:hypothetical protein